MKATVWYGNDWYRVSGNSLRECAISARARILDRGAYSMIVCPDAGSDLTDDPDAKWENFLFRVWAGGKRVEVFWGDAHSPDDWRVATG